MSAFGLPFGLQRLDVIIKVLREIKAALLGKPPEEGVVPPVLTIERLNNRYKIFTLNLANVRNDEPLGLKSLLEADGVKYARFMTVLALPAAMSYKLNSNANDLTAAALGEQVTFEITEMYITNAALAGNAILWIEWFAEGP